LTPAFSHAIYELPQYNGRTAFSSSPFKNGEQLVERFNQAMKKLLLAKTITTPIAKESMLNR